MVVNHVLLNVYLFSLDRDSCCHKEDFPASTLSWTRKHEAHRYFRPIPSGSCSIDKTCIRQYMFLKHFQCINRYSKYKCKNVQRNWLFSNLKSLVLVRSKNVQMEIILTCLHIFLILRLVSICLVMVCTMGKSPSLQLYPVILSSKIRTHYVH